MFSPPPKLNKAIADQIPKNYKKSIENRDKELIKVQRHVLSVGAPLTALHDMLESRQKLSHEELLNIVERAICLLGNAANSISVLRRSKILYAINPAKISLAEAPFPNAGKQLFGNNITKIAADSADIVRNLQKNLNQQHPQTPSSKKRKISSSCLQAKSLFFQHAKNRFQSQQQPKSVYEVNETRNILALGSGWHQQSKY